MHNQPEVAGIFFHAFLATFVTSLLNGSDWVAKGKGSRERVTLRNVEITTIRMLNIQASDLTPIIHLWNLIYVPLSGAALATAPRAGPGGEHRDPF